ncbi:MAG: hypothetical protein N3F03_01460 [Ignavibacteria bacterium]|nr:hypothetical protein [Ignavibacteria bacterium]
MRTVIKEFFIFNFSPLLVGYIVVADRVILKSIFFGWVVVLINFIIGLIAFNLSKNQDNKNFLKIYFGGMILRLIILLIIIFGTLKFIGINPISFLFSLFIFYIINQIIELRHITKSLTKR